jgi:hypothetical protein
VRFAKGSRVNLGDSDVLRRIPHNVGGSVFVRRRSEDEMERELTEKWPSSFRVTRFFIDSSIVIVGSTRAT